VEHHTVLAKGRKLLPPNTGVLLSFVVGDEQGRQVPLIFERTILGRKSGDIIVRDSLVSSMHTAIEYEAGAFKVVDLGSSNGTFVRGERIRQALVSLGDPIQLGQTVVTLRYDLEQAAELTKFSASRMQASAGGMTELLDREFIESDAKTSAAMTTRPAGKPLERAIYLRVSDGQKTGKELSFLKSQISVGRTQCDIVLPDPVVYREHALIEMAEGGHVILRDLASSNGTFVNELRVSDRVLEEGDVIRLGQCRITYLGLKA